MRSRNWRSLVVTECLLALGVMGTVFFADAAPAAADDFSNPNFSTEVVATVPPYTLVGLRFAADGRLFVWEKNGVIRIIKNGVMLPTPFIDLSAKVNTVDDRGFWGFAFDPDFASNGYVYMTYTYEEGGNPTDPGPKTSRLTRVTVDPSNPDVALPNTEVTILGSIGIPPCSNYPPGSDCIGDEDTSHSIGNLEFGADGTLYVGSGDGAHTNFADPLALRAQDLNNYNGKILRINKDGTAPTDNPFYDGTNSIPSKVWIYGVRNPFRFSIQPGTGDVWFGDVGWNTWEEINHGVKGGNYGWPCYEGVGPQPSYQAQFSTCSSLPASAVTPPFYTYDHTQGTAAIGGPFYNGTAYPQEYRGNFFFADYSGNYIKRVVFDANNQPVSVQPFATNVAAPVSMTVGPDGLIYYLSFTTGEIRRIRANGPSAAITATPTSGLSPLPVAFSSANTVNPGGGPLTYLWDFGDGTTSTAANPNHTYTFAGVKTYTVMLTVTDSTGLHSSATTAITIGSTPPIPTITMPIDGTHVQPGQTVTFQGSATDPQDGALAPSALSWTVLLHHNTHIHTFTGGTGTSGSFVVEDHGSIGTFSYEIILTATDSSGLKTSTSVSLPVDGDTVAPSVPGGVSAVAGGVSVVNVGWSASSDNVVVANYVVQRCSGVGCSAFVQVAAPIGTSFVDSGLLASTSYSYRVAAVDASGNVSGFSTVVTVTTVAAPPGPAGLVAGYSFDAGSGSVLADVSGNGNNGTVSGATWVAGKYGSALSFNGLSDVVQVASSASLNLSTGMTLAAWIEPTGAQSGWRTVMQRQVDAWTLNASNDGGALVPAGGGTFTGNNGQWITGTSASPVGSWTHVALTFDGSTLRLYVNGVQVSSRAVAGSVQSGTLPLWIGGNQPYGEYFKGLIDEARVYNRALSVAELQTVMTTALGTPPGPDTQAPSVPAGLSGSVVSASQVNLSWSASTDNVGVTGYELQRCAGAGCSSFVQVAAPAGTSVSDTGLAAGTSYSYRVRAMDAAGNASGFSSVVTVTTDAAPPGPAGLVAGYSFDAGSGSVLADVSGNGNNGTVSGATWVVGKYGSALSFNGLSDVVQVASSGSLNLSTGMTLAAWIEPTGAQSGWRTVMQRQVDAWTLNASNDGGALVPAGGGTFTGNNGQWITGTSASPVGSWTHVALTFDGSTLRLYVNGVQVSSRAVAGSVQSGTLPLWIGGNQPYGEYFKGLIDEARVYNRALSVAELQTVMTTALGTPTGPDTQAPSVPAGLAGSVVSASQVNLSWSASTDNVGVTGYELQRCAGAGCSSFVQVAAPAGTSVSDIGLAAGTSYSYRVRAMDAAGNASGFSTVFTVSTPAPDTQAPSVPAGLSGSVVSASQVNLSWSASTDNVGVTGYELQRCAGAGCSSFVQVAAPAGTSVSDTGLAAGTSYSYRVRAMDAAGNASGFSSVVTVTTDAAPPGPAGLVAGYSFDAGSGSVLADVSGNGNNGTVSGATWVVGKYGSALSFNGLSDVVQVASSGSLNLSTGMTLAAWIEPTGAQSGWRTVMQRQVDAWTLNASNDGGALVPAGGGTFTGNNGQWITGTSASPVGSWTHVALTFDGSTLRLYVNGVQVSSRAVAGSVQSGTLPLWIGGNQPYGEYFKGLIDEARVYNRALSVAELQTVMNTPLAQA